MTYEQAFKRAKLRTELGTIDPNAHGPRWR